MSEDDKPQGKPIVKAKLPAAKSMKRPDFTPHGIGGGPGRGSASRPSRLTAAKAKKRKKVAIIVSVTLAVVVAASIAIPVTYVATRPEPKVEVSGAFGKEPKVKIPTKLKPIKKLKVTDEVKGKGAKIANGDTTYTKIAFYKIANRKRIETSFDKPQLQQIVPIPAGKIGITALDKGLVGHTVGSRIVVEAPPGQGFRQDDQRLGITTKDPILFIMDVLGTFQPTAAANGTAQKLDDKKLPKVTPGKAGQPPKIEIPKGDPPAKLTVKTLVQGNGPALTKNDLPVMQREGKIWKGGKRFDTTYGQAQPGAPSGPQPMPLSGTVPGFSKGLIGQKVGSRVLLIIPPADGYGKKGNPQGGIKGDDTLVFVVDIVGKLATG